METVLAFVIGGHLTPILHFVRCVVVVHAVAVLQVLDGHRGWIGMPNLDNGTGKRIAVQILDGS